MAYNLLFGLYQFCALKYDSYYWSIITFAIAFEQSVKYINNYEWVLRRLIKV